MDTNLKWKKHTDKISNKCSKITGVLNRLKLLFPQEIKCLLYNSLIVPHINYCIPAWGFHRNRITIIQKKEIRIITASSYISHTEPLFKQLNLLKVEDILTLQELKFYFNPLNPEKKTIVGFPTLSLQPKNHQHLFSNCLLW